jgi:carotenoid phi-ring synthase / carotenoid chi-ring synthase
VLKSFLQSRIKNKLRGYSVTINRVDPAKPKSVSSSRKVAVVGAGLAGIGAASLLAERGFDVTLFDKNSYLGGKVGSWDISFQNGYTTKIDHGFHAFFRHYYNLRAFMEKIDATRRFEAIDDYLVLAADGKRYSFKNVETTPVLNILSLGKNKFFRFRDVLFNPPSWKMGEFLEYDETKTFSKYDGMSFEEFASAAELPPPLRLTFSTFARAFFAPGDRLSTAELMKSFHFFYLSHDHGLLYDYFDTDYEEALLQPIRRYLTKHNVSIRLNHPVEETRRENEKFIIEAESFDYLILASDVVGIGNICKNSPWINAASETAYSQLTSLQVSCGYAVYRIWLDKRTGDNLPVFIITEKRDVLDSVTFYHQFDRSAAEWASRSGGGVYELHCYALPEKIGDADVKAAFLAELHRYFPELRDAKMIHDHLQVRRDFTAFYTNLSKNRPEYRTAIPNLYLAGDWVKTGTPAMLMEGAFTSGILSANGILTENGLQEEPVLSVPPRGLFAKRD